MGTLVGYIQLSPECIVDLFSHTEPKYSDRPDDVGTPQIVCIEKTS